MQLSRLNELLHCGDRSGVSSGHRGLRPYAMALSMYEYEYTCGFCLIYWGVRIILNIMTMDSYIVIGFNFKTQQGSWYLAG